MNSIRLPPITFIGFSQSKIGRFFGDRSTLGSKFCYHCTDLCVCDANDALKFYTERDFQGTENNLFVFFDLNSKN